MQNELDMVLKRGKVIKTRLIAFLIVTLTCSMTCPAGFAGEHPAPPAADPGNASPPTYLPEEQLPEDLTEDDILGMSPEDLFPSSESIWAWDASVSLGAGYKKNILYSSIYKEDNPFVRAQGDVMLYGLWGDDQILTGYLDVENNHYFSLDEGDDESIVMAYVEWQKNLSQTLQLGLSGGYSYFHLFFDTSASDLEQDTTVLKEHLFEFSPYLEKAWNENWTTDGHLRLIRNVYDDSIDNSTEFESELGLAFLYGHDSKVRLSYIWNRDEFDDRKAKTPEGEDVAGKELLRKSHEIELRSKHAWDAQKVWTSRTDVSVRICEDNDQGYDDYNRFSASEKISFEKGKWTAAAGIAVTRYDSGNRKVSEDNIDYTTTTGTFEIRHAIESHWTLFFESEHELQHYEEFENYTVTTLLLGVQWKK